MSIASDAFTLPTTPIRVGIIGAGVWAYHFLIPSLLYGTNAQSYKIVAVGGRSLESATKSAEKFSEQIGHTVKAVVPVDGADCAQQMANDPEIDMVMVSVQAHNHREVITPIIEAGKQFLLEWPVGGPHWKSVAAAAKEKNVRNLIGLHNQGMVALKRVRNLIDAGKIGKPLYTGLDLVHRREIMMWGPEVSEAREYGSDINNGATMRNILAGHTLHQLISLLGNFTSLSATAGIQFPTYTVTKADGTSSEPRPNNAWDHLCISGTTDQGLIANVNYRSGYPRGEKDTIFNWVIEGETGYIEIKTYRVTAHVSEPEVYLNGERVDLHAIGNGTPDEDLSAVGNFGRIWEAYAKGDKSGYSDLEDGVKVFKLLDAITQSVEEGRVVHL